MDATAEIRRNPASKVSTINSFSLYIVWGMGRMTRDGTAESVSRDQIFRRQRGQGNVHFPCSADHEQDWQPYPVDPYSAICDDHTYVHPYYSITCLLFVLVLVPSPSETWFRGMSVGGYRSFRRV